MKERRKIHILVTREYQNERRPRKVGTQHGCVLMCVILLVDAHWTVSCYGQTKILQLDFEPPKFIWKLKQVESAGNFK